MEMASKDFDFIKEIVKIGRFKKHKSYYTVHSVGNQ